MNIRTYVHTKVRMYIGTKVQKYNGVLRKSTKVQWFKNVMV